MTTFFLRHIRGAIFPLERIVVQELNEGIKPLCLTKVLNEL